MSRRLRALPVLFVVWALLSIAPSGQSTTVPSKAPGVTVIGSVVDAALAPLAGVAVTLERDGRVEAKTTTDAAGAFRFADVAPGSYRVRAEHAGFPAFARDIRVPNGVTTLRFPIVLARAGDDLPKTTGATPAQRPSGVSAPPPPPPAVNPPQGQAGAAGGGRAGGAVGGVAAGRGAGGGGGGGRGGSTVMGLAGASARPEQYLYIPDAPWSDYRYPHSGESYAHVDPNRFESTRDQPLSTFGADVDTASYANVRRFLSDGQLPPRDAVRVEEFVNYFRFGYDEPRGNRPLALTTEIGDCPWAPSHKLVLIGARAKAMPAREIEGRNIVLLIDVSGSMATTDKLPLLRTAFSLFVDTLQPDDRLAIVTYAGSSGVALPSTPVRRRDVIQRAIAELSAGGSTNGGQGLIMAYRVAREQFIPGGVNRVILATDGDFNVGVVNQQDLVRLIEREKDSGVFLSVFGVGTGNLKDSTMEMLADRGNGHYAYLDSLQEARRVLVREADATLETVAKDVKFQVEFNPARVAAWKQIGYEDRVLAAQDFNNDRKDGGEMGAGHTVTVLYEVIPTGVENPDDDRTPGRQAIDPLRYQAQPAPARLVTADAGSPDEWLTVKARYKAPEGEVSDLIMQPVRAGGRVQHLPLASAIAEFGLLLRGSSRDAARWDALTARLDRIAVPASLRSDVDSLRELVAIARGLMRLR
jgi:Ca-activated chloride channel family protein